LVEHENGALREKLAGDIQPLLFRVRETRYAGRTNGSQSQIFNENVNLQGETIFGKVDDDF
jgi:hypothetical protein